MAILEINLEKPALVEEYQPAERTQADRQSTGEGSTARSSSGSKSSGGSESSGGGKAKLVGLLAVAAGIALLAWKLKGGSGGSELQGDSEKYEHGPEPEIGGDRSGGAKQKVASVLGLATAVVSLAAVVRKRRS
ncbi:hypothetical protein [Halorussus sp. AFM4]|uniref:hypothetical protein n=1 Tax=Halorussus sp. AFM4 TaxID=3421651 RepID=UPI003EBB0CAE